MSRTIITTESVAPQPAADLASLTALNLAIDAAQAAEAGAAFAPAASRIRALAGDLRKSFVYGHLRQPIAGSRIN